MPPELSLLVDSAKEQKSKVFLGFLDLLVQYDTSPPPPPPTCHNSITSSFIFSLLYPYSSFPFLFIIFSSLIGFFHLSFGMFEKAAIFNLPRGHTENRNDQACAPFGRMLQHCTFLTGDDIAQALLRPPRVCVTYTSIP